MSNSSGDGETTQTSTVKWWSDAKGFGFILDPEGGNDLFVHHTNIRMQGRRNLIDGQEVEYEPLQTTKGMQTVNVTPLGEG